MSDMRITVGMDSWTPSSQLDQTASRMAAMAAKRAAEQKSQMAGDQGLSQQGARQRAKHPNSTFDTYA